MSGVSQPIGEEELKVLIGQLGGTQATKSDDVTPWDRVVVWLISSVLAALVPVAITWVQVGSDAEDRVTFSNVLGDGELLLITVVLMIAGVGEMLLHLKDLRIKKRWLALFTLACILMIATASLGYGIVTQSEPGTADALSKHVVAVGSLASFALAGLLTSTCVWLAADAEAVN